MQINRAAAAHIYGTEVMVGQGLQNGNMLCGKSVTLLHVKPGHVSFQSGQRDKQRNATNPTVMVTLNEEHCLEACPGCCN